MKLNLKENHVLILIGWFIINLLQAVFTGLHSDESYYWMYSENLAFGYFDHPPFVAYLIHLGYSLVGGELGVRFFMILLSVATLGIILNELDEQEDFYFLSLFVLSFPLLHTHVSGFLAIPDSPLVFFTMLFLLLYRRYLKNPGYRNSIILAVVIAAMIYSKYHAFLIIGLTVFSNLRLLRQKYFWIAVGVTCFLLLPHLWWQIDNGFPTFRYHLVERAKPFRLKLVTDYLLNQLLVAGPLTGVLIFLKAFSFKIKSSYDRSLVFNVVGFYVILFLLSFKNRIEAHWTAAIMPMLMFMSYEGVKNDKQVKKWFKRLALPIVVLLLIFRIYLAIDAIPNIGRTKITFYQREASALEIQKMAEGRQVGFYNNYAAISNYIFYTGDSAVHLSSPGYRYCQYDLWDDENYATGKSVFAIQSKHMDPPNLTRLITGELKGHIVVQEFQSLTGLEIYNYTYELSEKSLRFKVILKNQNEHVIFANHVSQPVLALMQDAVEVIAVPFIQAGKDVIKPGEDLELRFETSKENLDTTVPFAIYTRTKEDIRGELVSVDPE